MDKTQYFHALLIHDVSNNDISILERASFPLDLAVMRSNAPSSERAVNFQLR